MTPKERARNILNELPFSGGQRRLYLEGLDKMTEEEVKPLVDQLEKSLNEAPALLEEVRILLKRRRDKKDRS